MSTLIALPIIRTAADLDEALTRLDAIIDAADGSPDADERTALSDLIAAYEDRHPVIPRGGPLAIIRHLMATHDLGQRDLPEIGAQSVVSAVVRGKRRINVRMAVALAQRFGLPVGAFVGSATAATTTGVTARNTAPPRGLSAPVRRPGAPRPRTSR